MSVNSSASRIHIDLRVVDARLQFLFWFCTVFASLFRRTRSSESWQLPMEDFR